MILALLAFGAGLLIGSFLNVCIYRLPRDLSVAKPARSFCPECEKTIAWYDNVPVVSYLVLGGRCRECKARIPVRYLMVELATAAAFALCVGALGLSIAALKYSIYSAIMIALVASDLEERILPDEFTLGGTLVGVAFSPFVPLEHYFAAMFIPFTWGERWQSVGESVFAAIVGSGSIWLVGWLYQKLRHREGLGFGDVKMIAMIGAFVGLRLSLMTLILASIAGSVLGLAYIKLTGKDASTYELPFGSFLGATALVVALWSNVIAVPTKHYLGYSGDPNKIFRTPLAAARLNASGARFSGNSPEIISATFTLPDARRRMAGSKRPQREPTNVTSLTITGAVSMVTSPWTVDFRMMVPRGSHIATAARSPSGEPVASTTQR